MKKRRSKRAPKKVLTTSTSFPEFLLTEPTPERRGKIWDHPFPDTIYSSRQASITQYAAVYPPTQVMITGPVSNKSLYLFPTVSIPFVYPRGSNNFFQEVEYCFVNTDVKPIDVDVNASVWAHITNGVDGRFYSNPLVKLAYSSHRVRKNVNIIWEASENIEEPLRDFAVRIEPRGVAVFLANYDISHVPNIAIELGNPALLMSFVVIGDCLAYELPFFIPRQFSSKNHEQMAFGWLSPN